jgi:hypothetical protein
MIPTNRVDILNAGLDLLEAFATRTSARGRFVALYLGLRRMGSLLKRFNDGDGTSASEIEQFLDTLYTKTHRPAPYVVLTAPFGQSTSRSAPYSTRSGEIAPEHRVSTNTWRNNLGIQKGIGCPAEAETIIRLLDAPGIRIACPHMSVDSEGRYGCGITGTAYRGEEHSIWLRITGDGYQAADLNHPSVYAAYLSAHGARIPVFPLIAVLYSLAPQAAYPVRANVGIPEFAEDFHFTLDQVETLFDCDPESLQNASLLGAIQGQAYPFVTPLADLEVHDVVPGVAPEMPLMLSGANPLPALGPKREINDGVGAELAVAEDLERCGWRVLYRGNQRSAGYDLEGERETQTIRVEVKSSISFTIPELSDAEWAAAQRFGEEYILAVVDFYGSPAQSLWYVRNPALTTTAVEVAATTYRLPRVEIEALRTEADFL